MSTITVARVRDLLDGLRSHVHGHNDRQREGLHSLLAGYRRAWTKKRKAQRATASEFNLLELLGVLNDEATHSRVLGWMLDWRESHAQGNLGLRIFLEELGLPAQEYVRPRCSVQREVSGAEARIDIEISQPGVFVIHIENKVLSGEGNRQLERETKDLKARARSLMVPSDAVYAFYLTPSGGIPSRPGCFRPISYRLVQRVAERFGAESRAPIIRWFASHYADAIGRFARQSQIEEDEDDE